MGYNRMLKQLITLLSTLMLLTACAGSTAPGAGAAQSVDVSGIPAGTFKASVTGALTGDFSGIAGYITVEGGGYLLNLSGTEGIVGATVSIILPSDAAAGTFTPQPYPDSFDAAANRVTAIGLSFSALAADHNAVDVYTALTNASLTLQSLDPMTGAFTFTAALEDGRAVTVTGTFNQIPVVQM